MLIFKLEDSDEKVRVQHQFNIVQRSETQKYIDLSDFKSLIEDDFFSEEHFQYIYFVQDRDENM